MPNEEGNEDRLTKNEFAELIQHLSIQEILAIEYRDGSEWNKLFCRNNVPLQMFFCNLCALETSSFKNLLAHIDGRKHKLQMERVKQLYHPDYTYPKNDEGDGYEKSVCQNNKNSMVSFTGSEQVVSGDNSKQKSQNIENMKDSASHGSNFERNKPNEILNVHSELELLNPSKQSVYEKELKVDEHAITENKEKKDRGSLLTFNKSKEKKQVSSNIGEKISPAYNNYEGDFKKRKIVINPAAALLMKAKKNINEDSSGNHQYQTDKLIIPTVHKKKSYNKALVTSTLQTIFDDGPKFSVKSYSSNPMHDDVYGILGVEYVIKILKNRNDVSPRYECGLCELVLDGFAMQRHLEGYNHRLKFCEKHFPTAIRQYRQYMHNVPDNEIFKVMTPVLGKLAIAIEKHYGRNLPYECYERDFSLNRQEILAKAYSCRHASEQYGPTFTHVVGSNEIDAFINNRHMYAPAPFSHTALFDTKPESTSCKPNNRHHIYVNNDKERHSRDRLRLVGRENTKSNDIFLKSYMSSGLHDDIYPPPAIYNQISNINLPQHDDEIYNLMVDDFLKGTLKGFSKRSTLCNIKKSSVSPPRNSSSGKRKSLSPLRENDIWQAYRHMVDQELYNLEERFHQYRKNPETHPWYNEEWQNFWKRRKDELVSAGLDHRKYNYQPEWVRFVKIRIEELYGQEVENIKIKSRERLCLPLSNEHIPDVKYHVRTGEKSLINENLTPHTDSINNLSSSLTSVYPSNVNIPQVVSVLRLMTALEDNLGSLGPKIINLLSKALQTEKSNPLQVNAIILSDENCSLIETAIEKFKGLVITGLFEGSKKKVVNQVVSDAEELLQYAHQFRQQLASERSSVESEINRTQINSSTFLDFSSSCTKHEQTNLPLFSNKKSKSSSSNENMLTRMDKKELASKLAASLVAQGKTDFEPRHLQELIAVYKLIEKKKRENAGNVLWNKRTLQEPTSSSKKTLSDTLSDLLKSSTSSVCKTSAISIIPPGSANKKPEDVQFTSIEPDVHERSVRSTSFTSVSQNSSDSYFKNPAHLKIQAFGTTGRVGNQLEPRIDYGMNYISNFQPNQQNSNMSNVYDNRYQHNNRKAPSWGWNSNTDTNQNYSMGCHNNNFNQTSSWRNF